MTNHGFKVGDRCKVVNYGNNIAGEMNGRTIIINKLFEDLTYPIKGTLIGEGIDGIRDGWLFKFEELIPEVRYDEDWI